MSANSAIKVVWITGASSGIGEQLAYKYAKEGYILILSSRKLSDLELVKKQCNSTQNIYLLPFDLANLDENTLNSRKSYKLYRKCRCTH